MAIGILKYLQSEGHVLILWTQRKETELYEAIKFCRDKGLEFYAVNKNYPGERIKNDMNQKIRADLYIDNKNLLGIPDWAEIYWMIQLKLYA